MSASNSRLAYMDCFELFDKALADPIGVRIKRRDWADASNFRSRLNYARQADRRDNTLIYQEGDTLHGRSAYDPILIRCVNEGGRWFVELKKVESLKYETESLSGLDESASSDNGKTEVKAKAPAEVRRA